MNRIDNVGVYDIAWYVGPMMERVAYIRTAWRVEPRGHLFGFGEHEFFCMPQFLEEDWES